MRRGLPLAKQRRNRSTGGRSGQRARDRRHDDGILPVLLLRRSGGQSRVERHGCPKGCHATIVALTRAREKSGGRDGPVPFKQMPVVGGAS